MNGPVPAGMHVCHKCDMPACINPAHLFLGTDLDNAKDKVAKGRCRTGIRPPNARLTESVVRSIRTDPRTTAEIARELGVSFTVIYLVRTGQTYKSVR